MPVTAKLSRRFYETFGDEIATELVEWFNAVDATYRADLREFNELNFARFDARLEQRLAEFKAEFKAELDKRLAEAESKAEQRSAALEVAMKAGFAQGRADMAHVRADLIKWSFLFWIGMVATVFFSSLL